MAKLPIDIETIIPNDSKPAVESWWSSLSDAQRESTSELWDERREICFFSPQSDDEGQLDEWESMPSVEGGRFIPHDDSVRMCEWLDDWLEYVSGHEEVVILGRVGVLFRTFHICRIESSAQTVIESGILPVDFSCSRESATCPMRVVQRVVPNRTMHLTPANAGGWWVIAPCFENDPAPRLPDE